jgi:hypothetical protein
VLRRLALLERLAEARAVAAAVVAGLPGISISCSGLLRLTPLMFQAA